MDISTLIDQLKNKGTRITRSREAILRYVSERKTPFTAMDLWTWLMDEKIFVHKSTVYREIEFMLQEHIVRDVVLTSREVHYESTYLEHHHHLLCVECDRIEDIDCSSLDMQQLKMMANKSGFEITDHYFEVRGICPACR